MKKTNLTRAVAVSDFGARISDFTPGRARFTFDKPDVHEVFVAGSFNNWNPTTTRMTQVGHGPWMTELLLPPGRYEYQFVADGRWLPDRSRELVLNPLGELNSVLLIPQNENGKSQASHIKRKWRCHYEKLINLRERLLKDRRERLGEAAEPVKVHAMNFAESATDEMDQEVALAELSAAQDALYEVEQALKRIAQGDYGKCEITGKPIARERLRAVPWTRFCAEVELQLESQGGLSHPCIGHLKPIRRPEAYPAEEELGNQSEES